MTSRVVLDTNQLIAALSRPPQLATFVMAWESNRFTVVASRELLDEYEYVFDYPQIRSLIEPELLRSYRTHLFQEIELVTLTEIPRLCRDPDDDKVLATALFGLVDCLLTEDNDLLTKEIKAILAASDIEVMSMSDWVKHLDTL